MTLGNSVVDGLTLVRSIDATPAPIRSRRSGNSETVRSQNIVGLYMNPPDPALVLCVDEKPQIQTTEVTAPVQPMRPGQV